MGERSGYRSICIGLLIASEPEPTDLWSNVVRRAAERRRLGFLLDVFFTHSEIRDLDVSVFVEQYIVEFQVTAFIPAKNKQTYRRLLQASKQPST